MNDLAAWEYFDNTWLFAGLVAILLSILLKYWKINTTSSINRSTEQFILKSQKILLALAFVFLTGNLLIPTTKEANEKNEFNQPHQSNVTTSTPIGNTRNELLSSPPAPDRIRSNRPTLTQPLDYNKNSIAEDRSEGIVNDY